jgi:hypothetical protein
MMIDQASDPKETEIILNSINSLIYELSLDSFACHVIEKIITKYEEKDIKNIYEIAIRNFILFANNANGLCVIKKILTNASENSTKEYLKAIVFKNYNDLIHQNYGNYVLDVVLDVNKF